MSGLPSRRCQSTIVAPRSIRQLVPGLEQHWFDLYGRVALTGPAIHPDLPTGNTQAIIMAVAEHAAKKIAAFKVAAGTTPVLPSTPATSAAPVATPSSSATPVNSTIPIASAVPSQAAEKMWTMQELISFLEEAASE